MTHRVLCRTRTLAAALTVAGLAAAAGAQQSVQRAALMPQGQGWEQPTSRMHSISGTVMETKEISVGGREPYLFANVEDDRGMERIVNLGPADDVAGSVSEGDQIEVRAVFLPVLGRDVYHTVALRTEDGQTKRVRQIQDPEMRQALAERFLERRQGGARFQQAGSWQRGFGGQEDSGRPSRMNSISGTVMETKEISVGGREPYLFANVEDDRGMERIVNLGPADDVAGSVSEGDQIEVRAVFLPVLGRDVYHTVALRTEDGQTKRVRQIQDPEMRQALAERFLERRQGGARFQQAGSWQRGFGGQEGAGQSGLRQLGLDPSRTGRMSTIEGTITKTKEVSLDGREPYLFANVEDDRGMERIVNLGPADDVAGSVSEGDQIEVRAVFLPILGRDVYHTVALRTEDGQTMRVHQIQDPEVRQAIRQRFSERRQEQRREWEER